MGILRFFQNLLKEAKANKLKLIVIFMAIGCASASLGSVGYIVYEAIQNEQKIADPKENEPVGARRPALAQDGTDQQTGRGQSDQEPRLAIGPATPPDTPDRVIARAAMKLTAWGAAASIVTGLLATIIAIGALADSAAGGDSSGVRGARKVPSGGLRSLDRGSVGIELLRIPDGALHVRIGNGGGAPIGSLTVHIHGDGRALQKVELGRLDGCGVAEWMLFPAWFVEPNVVDIVASFNAGGANRQIIARFAERAGGYCLERQCDERA